MRRAFVWLGAVVAAAAMAAPCSAVELVATPSKPTGYWAGTRLTLGAERASSGRLRVRVAGTVGVASAARVTVRAEGCGAGTDTIASYNWTPESHPAGRQAIPASPTYQQTGARFDLRLARGKRHVSLDAVVSYGYLDVPAPSWTDCVTLMLAKRSKNGADANQAFELSKSTLYVSVGLGPDGRHVPCGAAPAFCTVTRTEDYLPPALPDFPPAPGYPGSPGYGEPAGDTGKNYPYHVCPIDGGRFVLCSAEQAAAARGATSL